MISFSVGPAQLVYCTSHLPPRIFTDRPELASEMKLRLLMLFFATALAAQKCSLELSMFFSAMSHGCGSKSREVDVYSTQTWSNLQFQGVCRKHSRGWDPNLSTFVVDVAAICQANRSKLMDAAKLEPEDHQAEFFRNVSVPIWCYHCLLYYRLGLRKFQRVRFSLQCYELVWWRPLGIPGYPYGHMVSWNVIVHWFHMGVVQKVLVLRVVFDDLWYAKMTFGES